MTKGLMLIVAFLLVACSPSPRRGEPPKPDPTKEAWYGETIDQVASMTREAQTLFRGHRMEEAGVIVTKGQPLIHRLLSAPEPTLPAMEAVSDLDDLYGQMLLANHQYVWARVLFQKNP